MTPENEKKYGISSFDDELQVGDKISAWQRAEIKRLSAKCNEHKSNAMSAEYREAELSKLLETACAEVRNRDETITALSEVLRENGIDCTADRASTQQENEGWTCPKCKHPNPECNQSCGNPYCPTPYWERASTRLATGETVTKPVVYDEVPSEHTLQEPVQSVRRPREWWLAIDEGDQYECTAFSNQPDPLIGRVVHVREVT